MTTSRESNLARWFHHTMGGGREGEAPDGAALEAVSGDASFRRYFRIRRREDSWILVDAPPEREDCRPFVSIARRFLAHGVPVPEVLAADQEQGFMCLSDFGDTLLWRKLAGEDSATAGALYHQAFDELLKIQSLPLGGDFSLPSYDEALLTREMHLFRDWFSSRLLGLEAEPAPLEDAFPLLADAALAQPRVCVHRDYHSRNLMVLPGGGLGVLDFQDAVEGPWTYDLVSLLKDCYVAWPPEQVREWALEYRKLAISGQVVQEMPEADFLHDFELMGVQRHLKAVGIFARLYLRDGKPGYLRDIPRTLDYVRETLPRHPRLSGFGAWLEGEVLPAMDERLAPLLRERAS